jgi:hypothetical protein
MKCLSIESFEYYYFIPILSQLAEYWGDVKMASLGKIMSQQVKQHLLHTNDLHFLFSSSFLLVDSKQKESKIKSFQTKEQLKYCLFFSNKIQTKTEKPSFIFPRNYEEAFNLNSSDLSFFQSSSLSHTMYDERTGWTNRKKFLEQKNFKLRAFSNLMENFQNQKNFDKKKNFLFKPEFENFQKYHSTLPISQMDPAISYMKEKKIDSLNICGTQLKIFDSLKSNQLMNSNFRFQSYENRREKKNNKFFMENFSLYGLKEEKNILSQLYKLDSFFFQLVNKTKKEEFQKSKITRKLLFDLFSFFPVYQSVFYSSEELKSEFGKPIEHIKKNKIVESIREPSEKDLYFLLLQILRDRKIWKAQHWYPFLSDLSLNLKNLPFSHTHMLSSSYELSSSKFFSSKFCTKEQNNLGQDPSRTIRSKKELIEKKIYCSFIKLSESEKKMSELVTMLMSE